VCDALFAIRLKETLAVLFTTISFGRPLSAGYIPTRDVTLSPDGTKLYIGRGNHIKRSTGEVDQILVTDTSSGRRLKTILTSRPFWNLALSRDGNTLYAISALTRSLILIDTSSYQEVGTIENIGKGPTRAIVVP
jgi:DNA-binding beta-propeller fold protein YncE